MQQRQKRLCAKIIEEDGKLRVEKGRNAVAGNRRKLAKIENVKRKVFYIQQKVGLRKHLRCIGGNNDEVHETCIEQFYAARKLRIQASFVEKGIKIKIIYVFNDIF